MGKNIYVKGAILIDTPLFICPDAGAYYEIPKDSIIIEPNAKVEGCQCLVIDEENPQSIFNSYFAKFWMSSYKKGNRYLIDEFEDIYQEYQERIKEIQELYSSFSLVNEILRYTFHKMVYLSIVSTVDSFLCSVILHKMVHNEQIFLSCAEIICTKKQLEKYSSQIGNSQWEQMVIKQILCSSYCKEDRIKQLFKKCSINIDSSDLIRMKIHFKNRHVLVHRNGKTKNGEYLEITDSAIQELLSDCRALIEKIKELVQNAKYK